MVLTVTDSAAGRLATIITEQAKDGEGLRVMVQGGRCACSSSFAMGIDVAAHDDAIVEVAGIRFILDPAAAEKLEGASIDYVEDVMQQGFSIQAPNAAGEAGGGDGCACGGAGH